MTPARLLSLLPLPLASLTSAGPISVRARFNETSLAESLDGQTVSVADGVLEKRAPPPPIDWDKIGNQWNAPPPGGSVPPPAVPPNQPHPGTAHGDPMDIDAPGPSRPRPGVAAGGATVVDPQQEASTRPKGKGKATAATDSGQPVYNAVLRRYEHLGRTMYNQWLWAPTVQEACNLMSMPASVGGLGPDPHLTSWDRSTSMTTVGLSRYWTYAFDNPNFSQQPSFDLKAVLNGLVVGHQDGTGVLTPRTVGTELYPQGPNAIFTMDQNVGYMSNAREQKQPLQQGYTTLINPIDGVIIALRSLDAVTAWERQHNRQLSVEDRPKLWTWSDTTWKAWMGIRTPQAKGPNSFTALYQPSGTTLVWSQFPPRLPLAQLALTRDNLNHIIVVNLNDQDTLNIIDECLASRPIVDRLQGFTNDRGESFAIGHWCFYALMATESSTMIPAFLAQHRGDPQFGQKVLWNVNILMPPPQAGQTKQATLRWQITADLNQAQVFKQANEKFWAPQKEGDELPEGFCYPRLGYEDEVILPSPGGTPPTVSSPADLAARSTKDDESPNTPPSIVSPH